eukprot:gene10390-11471_t
MAIPFDKGIGICIMSVEMYKSKLNDVIKLPQFEKVLPKRKNEKHPVLKEEERITSILKDLRERDKIMGTLYDRLKPVGSQPPRLYGLAKIHKVNVPMRPVLSMPGSAYYKIANQICKWLSVVEECNINSSTKIISDSLSDIKLKENDELVSFDVTSLYTNVPLHEAIDDCTELLYSGRYEEPPVDRETFKELVSICSCNVLMLTSDGYYRQVNGLAMGSPPAPMLANGWMSKFDSLIRDEATLYSRYMDDIIREINNDHIDEKLREINNLHPSLKFTIEQENNAALPFLDMKIQRSDGKLSSKWYTKPTDTGVKMNFHALVPQRYKRSVVSGLVHRIYPSCSTWYNFHESLVRAKVILENNQYPSSFYDPIIEKTLNKIVENRTEKENMDNTEGKEEEKMLCLQYRGKESEKLERALRKLNAPCKVVFTLKELRSLLPSLKPEIEKSHKSGVVYKITCPRCNACYVGQTSRHLQCRIKEHERNVPVSNHLKNCDCELSMENVLILCSTFKSVYHLMTLEALMINELKPILNTKDEYRSRSLKCSDSKETEHCLKDQVDNLQRSVKKKENKIEKLERSNTKFKGMDVAAKCYLGQPQIMVKEYQILNILSSHPNIPYPYGLVTRRIPQIITSYSLNWVPLVSMKPDCEQKLATIVSGVIKAVSHIHHNGILHNNIHHKNVVVDANTGTPTLLGYSHVCLQKDAYVIPQVFLDTFGKDCCLPFKVKDRLQKVSVESDLFCLGFTICWHLRSTLSSNNTLCQSVSSFAAECMGLVQDRCMSDERLEEALARFSVRATE